MCDGDNDDLSRVLSIENVEWESFQNELPGPVLGQGIAQWGIPNS
jgi:hypothetical protein